MTTNSRCSVVFSVLSSGLVSRGVVSLPVKIERDSHMKLPGCDSAGRVRAVKRALEGHATKVGVVDRRLQI